LFIFFINSAVFYFQVRSVNRDVSGLPEEYRAKGIFVSAAVVTVVVTNVVLFIYFANA